MKLNLKKNKRIYRLYKHIKYNIFVLNKMKIYNYILYYILLNN